VSNARDRRAIFDTLMRSPLAAAPFHQHPLGFLVARIDGEAGTAIRLHIWSDYSDARQTGFEVHDHAFDLKSLVVVGEVKQTTYDAVEQSDGAFRIYSVRYGHQGSSLAATRRLVDLVPRQEVNVIEGQSYSLKAQVLHRLECVGQCAATIVLTLDRGTSPLTIGPKDGPKELRSERLPALDGVGKALILANSEELRSVLLGKQRTAS
jgi:hypothetical protein